jgi:hypothetical protein
MGLNTDQIQKATEALENFTKQGITVNVDKTTIQSVGVYFVVAALVGGFAVATFNFIFRRFLG